MGDRLLPSDVPGYRQPEIESRGAGQVKRLDSDRPHFGLKGSWIPAQLETFAHRVTTSVESRFALAYAAGRSGLGRA